MIKKILALVLAFTLVFSLAACTGNKETGKPSEKIVPSDKKVAILVAPEAQYPEDYAAAMSLQAQYPDNVIVKEYSDSRILQAGDGPIITLSEELANDETVGAIVYARATEFTNYAISKAKAANPDLITIAIEPEDKLSAVANAANLVLTCDWEAAANDAVKTAASMGAKYFVFFSFERHTRNELVDAQRNAFKAACEGAGIEYIYTNCVDPTNAEGISKAQLVIKEQVAQLELNKKIMGSDVVLFSTDSAVQSTLVELAKAKGMIYLSGNFPSVYSGISEVFEVAAAENYYDTEAYIRNISTAVKADAENKARFASYNFNLMATLVFGAVYSAFDMLNATTTADNLAEKVILRLTDAADSKTFTAKAYNDTMKNVFCAYNTDAFTVI